jgi:hypothetical protein
MVSEAELITDAPYNPGQKAIDIRTGAIGGGAGAVAMAMMVSVLSGAGSSLAWFFAQIGSVFIRGRSPEASITALALGVLVHLSLGVGLGMLYASCLRRQEIKALFAIAISYGVLLWIVPGFPLSFAFDDAILSLLRSPSWLSACLVYSSVLLAITLAKLAPRGAVSVGAH